MKKYIVEYDIEAETDIGNLNKWVAEKSSYEFARRFINRIFDEIEKLSYLAGVLPPSRNMMPLRYHPEDKTIPVGKRKLTVIFHIEGDYVIVDKILPSAMVTY
ncbi:MAG: hypothetical protein IKX13_05810 [Bacteroidales bacterium]|nr:hypothetical protein [Bacteroidales bacterium]